MTLRCSSSIMTFLRRRDSRAALRFCSKRTLRAREGGSSVLESSVVGVVVPSWLFALTGFGDTNDDGFATVLLVCGGEIEVDDNNAEEVCGGPSVLKTFSSGSSASLSALRLRIDDMDVRKLPAATSAAKEASDSTAVLMVAVRSTK